MRAADEKWQRTTRSKRFRIRRLYRHHSGRWLARNASWWQWFSWPCWPCWRFWLHPISNPALAEVRSCRWPMNRISWAKVLPFLEASVICAKSQIDTLRHSRSRASFEWVQLFFGVPAHDTANANAVGLPLVAGSGLFFHQM